MWKEGDGNQQLKFYLNDLGWVVQDLVQDPSLKGLQVFDFQVQKDSEGLRVFGEATSSLKFQEAAAAVGPGKVPLSIIIYIDGTFMKHGMDVRPMYSK